MKMSRIRQLWDLFVLAETSSYEKSAWCDIFLCQFLLGLHDGNPVDEILTFWNNRNGVGTLIGCELLSDIQQVCSQPGDGEDLQPLKRHLLLKTWKSLAALLSLGQLNLSCSYELANLLISLFPISLDTTKDLSGASKSKKNKYIFWELENGFWSSPYASKCYQPHGQGPSRVEYFRSHSLNVRNRKISRGSNCTRRNKDVESSESENPGDDLNVGNKSYAFKLKVEATDFDYFTCAVHSEEASGGAEGNTFDLVLYKQRRKSKHPKKISPLDFMDERIKDVMQSQVNSYEFSMLVIQLLTSLCRSENSFSITTDNSSSICLKSVKFAVEHLCSVQFESASPSPLEKREMTNLKCALTHLLVTSLEKIMDFPNVFTNVILTGILPMTLKVLEDFVFKLSCQLQSAESNEDNSYEIEKENEVIFGLMCSVISFLFNLLTGFPDVEKIRYFLEFFKIFIESNNGKLIEKTLVVLTKCGKTFQAKKVIGLIGKLIIELKEVRKNAKNHPYSRRFKQRKCKNGVGLHQLHSNPQIHHYHHHCNDVFGSVFTSPTVDSKMVQKCCVSSLFLVLVKLVGKPCEITPDVVNRILKVMNSCGTCCCFSLTNIFQPFIEIIRFSSQKSRLLVFQLLETTLYPALGFFEDGLSDESVKCSVCSKRLVFDGAKPIGSLEEDIQTPSNGSEKNFLLSPPGTELHLHTSIFSFDLFKDLLSSDDFKIVQAVTAHLLKCAPKMSDYGKHIVLFEIFLPTFLSSKSKFITEQDEIAAFRIMSSLSVFSSLLHGFAFARRFITQKGLDHVLDLISVENFTENCCAVLEKTIIFSTMACDADANDVSSLVTLKKAVDKANDSFFKLFEKQGEERLSTDNETKETKAKKKTHVLKNVSVFWRTYANLALHSPVLRKYFSKVNFQADCSMLLKIALFSLLNKSRSDEEKNSENRDPSATTCWLMKFIESLLTFILATSGNLEDGREENDTTAEKLFNDFLADDLGNVDVRRLAEILLKCSLVQPYSIQMIPLDSTPKLIFIPVRNSCVDVEEREYDEEEQLTTEFDSLDDDYVTADEGYDADIEVRDNITSPGEATDWNFHVDVTDSVAFFPPTESLSDHRNGHLIIHPNLCILAIDLLIRSYEKNLISKPNIKENLFGKDRPVDAYKVIFGSSREKESSKSHYESTSAKNLLYKERENDERAQNEVRKKENYSGYSGDNGIVGLVSVFQRLVSLCKENHENCLVLCRNKVIYKLLCGFRTCFVQRNNSLIELQKVILELFTILAKISVTPEELSIYLSFFKHENPPLDYLVHPIVSLVTSYSPQPNRSLRFPATACGEIADGKIMDFGKKMNFRHKAEGVDSCWSAAALSLPIDPQWNWSAWARGFSVSIWLRIEKPIGKNQASKGKPIIQSKQGRKIPKCEFDESVDRGVNESLRLAASKQKDLHLFSIGTDYLTLECWNTKDFGSFIWRLSRIDYQKGYEIIAERSVEHNLSNSTWIHLAVNVKTLSSRKTAAVEIGLFSNGEREGLVLLPLPCSPSRRCKPSSLLLGSQGEPSSRGSFFFGNLMLFAYPVFTRETAVYLLALGPNSNISSDCHVGSQKPNFTVIFPMKSLVNEIDWKLVLDSKSTCEMIRNLCNHLFLTYTAENPKHFDIYPINSLGTGTSLFPGIRSRAGPESRGMQQPPVLLKVSLLSLLDRFEYRGFISSAYILGGSATFLFLFARVVEISNNPEEQEEFLYFFLKFVQSDSDVFTQFVESEHYKMLHKVFSVSKCWSGPHILKAILNACCDKPIIKNVGNRIEVIHQSDSIVVNSCLISTVLKSWKDWCSASQANQVLHLLLMALLVLVKDEHPYREFNVFQLNRVKIVKSLLSFCKERILFDEMKLVTANVSFSLIELVKSLMSAPPEISHISAVMDCLILLHPANATFITHAKSSSYLILSPGHTYCTRGPVETGSKVSEISSLKLESYRFSDHRTTYHNIQAELKKLAKHNFRPNLDFSEKKKRISHVQLNGRQVIDSFNLNSRQENGTVDDNRYSDSSQHFEVAPVTVRTVIKTQENLVIDKSGRTMESLITNAFAESQSSGKNVLSKTEDENLAGKKWEKSDKSDENRGSQSIIVEGLLLLLRDILLIIPDSMTSQILNHVVKPEILLVLANQKDSHVRSAVVEVFSSYLQRCSADEINKFIKLRGFYHLANQISLFPASPGLLEACCQLLAHGSAFTENEDFPADERFAAAGFPILLALVPRCVHDAYLAHNLIDILSRIFFKSEDSSRLLLETGLVESLVKTLVVFAHFGTNETNDSNHDRMLWMDLINFFLAILSRTLSSPGTLNMQIFTDILFQIHYVMGLEKKNCGMESRCVMFIRDAFFRIVEEALDILQNRIVSFENNPKQSKNAIFYSALNGNPKEGSSSANNLRNLSTFVPSPGSTYATQASRFISKSELCERMKFLVASAVEFLMIFENSDNQSVSLSQTEIGFIHYFFPTLLQMLSSKLGKRNADDGCGAYWAVKDSLKAETFKLLTWMMSPQQQLRIRVFPITILASQTNSKALLSTLLTTCNRAESIFALYLTDLMYNNKLNDEDLKNCLFLKEEIRVDDLLVRNLSVGDEVVSYMESRDAILAELERQSSISLKKEIYSVAGKCYNRYEGVIKSMSEDAILMTRLVVNAQNTERKSFMEEMKLRYCEDVHLSVKWNELISKLTHEKAVWHFEKFYPAFWELDPTEGPSRVRKRLTRCHLNLDERFFLPSERHKLNKGKIRKPLDFLFWDEESSRASAALIEKLHCNEKIRSMFSASIVTPAAEIMGELLLGETSIYFVADDKQEGNHLAGISNAAWLFRDIKEIHCRRFELQERAIEIFLTNGKTYLIAFESSEERDALMGDLVEAELPNRVTGDSITDTTQLWREGLITNWEYLTQLNKLAGRSYNDLMQYPVYPFVLSDYSSSTLDLGASTAYRNFQKPMAVQEKKNEVHYINNYNELVSGLKQVSLNKEPYHYGSHYSNSGTVLHFLVRLPPFTKMLLQYQDRNFDLPDRTFHSLHTTWRLASSESTTDVKELIPEFFFLPEFLVNFQGFNFGVRQNGETVNDVLLPPWCKGDPRRFVLIHRQAMESDYVTKNLPHWIDLVFGFKQTGRAAVEAINVFHPATYSGFDVQTISDPVERVAWETMVKTYGQTPKQLFKTPHPFALRPFVSSTPKHSEKWESEGLKNLKWGQYVGSPSEPHPVIVWKQTFIKGQESIAHLVALATNDVLGLPPRSTPLLQYTKEKWPSIVNICGARALLISWGYNDRIIRAKCRKEVPVTALISTSAFDSITTCWSEPGSNHLWIGHSSGNITVYRFDFVANDDFIELSQIPTTLQGHKNAVTNICISQAFSVAVTSSSNGQIIIWDLNSTSYVRSLGSCSGAVKALAVSDTLGDIASVASNGAGDVLRVHTINAALVGSLSLGEAATCVCFSRAPEGASVNAIACGFADGTIRLFSTWDLSLLREISSPSLCHSVFSLTYTADSLSLYASYSDGTIVAWETPTNSGKFKTKNQTKFFMLKM